jgi:hypothetical protein
MTQGAYSTSLSAKTEFTNEDRRQMLNLLQTGPNTGNLQAMLMSGGPISADNMTALITKLRELDTQSQMPETLKDKFKQIEKTLDLFAQKPPSNASNIKDTLADFQLRQLYAVNGTSGFAEDTSRNLFDSQKQAEMATLTALQSPNPLEQGPGLTLQNNPSGPGLNRVV